MKLAKVLVCLIRAVLPWDCNTLAKATSRCMKRMCNLFGIFCSYRSLRHLKVSIER